jgi:hypothetical protein
MTNTPWRGCYDGNWKGLIVEESFAHPAKFSRALIDHIYQHAKDEGWIHPGSTIVDPFGGVALGAIEAMKHGCHWLGSELEPQFVRLGNQNIALWNRRFSTLPGWGTAVLLQGDSRKLCEIVQGQVECCVSSPPYTADALGHKRGKAGANREATGQYKQGYTQGAIVTEYYADETPGNLAAMPAGSFDAAISSPPFMDARQDTTRPRPPASMDGALAEKDGRLHRLGACEYGQTPGNLASLPAGRFDMLASSPPYEGIQVRDNDVSHSSTERDKTRHGGRGFTDAGGGTFADQGQLSALTTTTFWTAARAIVSQCYDLLKPGAVSIWVVKGFVRKGKLVDFPHQWQALCESIGFVLLHEHHAMLTQELDEQFHLNGGSETRTIERKSFFRRLAEKKGSPAINYETVLCLKKADLHSLF